MKQKVAHSEDYVLYVLCLLKKTRCVCVSSPGSSSAQLGGGVFESINTFLHNKGWWRTSKSEKCASPNKYVNYQRQGWNVIVDGNREDRCF